MWPSPTCQSHKMQGPVKTGSVLKEIWAVTKWVSGPKGMSGMRIPMVFTAAMVSGVLLNNVYHYRKYPFNKPEVAGVE